MATVKQRVSYADWKPVVTPEEVFTDRLKFYDIRVTPEAIFWLEERASEGGRRVIVQSDAQGKVKDITPKGFSAWNEVHGYGGASFAVQGSRVYFVNQEDQRIYCQDTSLDNPPVPLTRAPKGDSKDKYASLEVTPDGTALVFVYERKNGKEPENFVAALDLRRSLEDLVEPTILAKGNDFYGTIQLSPDGRQIAFATWNHPHMPWNGNALVLADLVRKEGAINLENERVVAGSLEGTDAICQPKFDTNDWLYFVMDSAEQPEDSPKNWWNIYRYKDGVTEAVTQELTEFGEPDWRFGLSKYTVLPDGRLVACFVKDGKERLAQIDPETKTLSVLETELDIFEYVESDTHGRVIFAGSSPTRLPSIVRLDPHSGESKVLRTNTSAEIPEEALSTPHLIKYPTSDGGFAYGHLYLPKNPNYEVPTVERPALIVMAHGGPISKAKLYLELSKQFWTSQGFAILDIDYRGSVRYGRQYRDALLRNWGVADADDIRNGVEYLIREGIVDPEKVAITGGSAGGYAVQRALTLFPDLFKVGASYYGIGDIMILAKETHKFESRSLDGLIAPPTPEGQAIYRERSPINHIDRLSSPMIFFQGLKDKIVPPGTSESMVAALRSKGISCEYVTYPEEEHGFKAKENLVDALEKEASFFRRVLFKSESK